MPVRLLGTDGLWAIGYASVESRTCTEDTNQGVIGIRVMLKATRVGKLIKDMSGQWKMSKD